MESEYECHKIMISIHGVFIIIIKGKNFSEYNNEFKLRTDAVW
jgi:hypothetical protein